ncbi:hypothetical protein B0H11DRAFT_1935432 [Mycena galericulata]|nr:hypothetical protein B0H11DRAFT_1935432 [Mycena galericulata]
MHSRSSPPEANAPSPAKGGRAAVGESTLHTHSDPKLVHTVLPRAREYQERSRFKVFLSTISSAISAYILGMYSVLRKVLEENWHRMYDLTSLHATWRDSCNVRGPLAAASSGWRSGHWGGQARQQMRAKPWERRADTRSASSRKGGSVASGKQMIERARMGCSGLRVQEVQQEAGKGGTAGGWCVVGCECGRSAVGVGREAGGGVGSGAGWGRMASGRREIQRAQAGGAQAGKVASTKSGPGAYNECEQAGHEWSRQGQQRPDSGQWAGRGAGGASRTSNGTGPESHEARPENRMVAARCAHNGRCQFRGADWAHKSELR